MSTDEYLIGSGAPMKSNAINYTSDDDDPRGENAVMGLLSNSQFIRRMDWRKKFNENAKPSQFLKYVIQEKSLKIQYCLQYPRS